MSPILIQKEQKKDKELKCYSVKKVEGVSLIHFEGKIFIPKLLRGRIVVWYRNYLVHPGKTCMEATIRQIFTWPGLKPHVEQWCRTCHNCQVFKEQWKSTDIYQQRKLRPNRGHE